MATETTMIIASKILVARATVSIEIHSFLLLK